jgi:hypothetical protein
MHQRELARQPLRDIEILEGQRLLQRRPARGVLRSRFGGHARLCDSQAQHEPRAVFGIPGEKLGIGQARSELVDQPCLPARGELEVGLQEQQTEQRVVVMERLRQGATLRDLDRAHVGKAEVHVRLSANEYHRAARSLMSGVRRILAIQQAGIAFIEQSQCFRRVPSQALEVGNLIEQKRTRQRSVGEIGERSPRDVQGFDALVSGTQNPAPTHLHERLVLVGIP